MDYHLPIIFCVDTSSFMNELSENGKSKLQVVEEEINSLANIELEHSENNIIDVCIITFNDKVEVMLDWIPLSKFCGGIKFKAEGNSALGTAVITAIDIIRKRRRLYLTMGIPTKQAKILLFTDRMSTDGLKIAYEKCQGYLYRSFEKPSIKMYISLVSSHVNVYEFVRLLDDKVITCEANNFILNQQLFDWLREDSLMSYGVPPYCKIKLSLPNELENDTIVDEYDWDDAEEAGESTGSNDGKSENVNCNGASSNYGEVIRPKNPMGVHIPVVLCIDTSSSMSDAIEDGKSKKQIFEEMINGLVNLPLTDFNKKCIDICILVFDDEVRTLVEWRPLSDFYGNIELDVAGTTALGSAVIETIKKSKERRRDYAMLGIQSIRPLIFFFTDGLSTQPLDEAYEFSQYYLNNNKAKMYITIIPPLRECSELKAFGDKVTIFRANDCTDGIKSSFDFFQECIMYHFCARSSDNTHVLIPDNLEVLNRNGKDDIKMENDRKYSNLQSPCDFDG